MFYSCHNSALCLNRWPGAPTGAEAAFAVTSAGVAVEDGDAKPEAQDLLVLAAGAGSRTHRRHRLHLGISGCRLLT